MKNIEDLQTRISNWKETLQRSVGVRDDLLRQKKDWDNQKEEKREAAEKAIQSLNFVEESVKSIRNKTLRSIESVANESLQSVYDQNLKLECDFGIKRDRSAVTLRYMKKIDEENFVKRNPDGSGCGVSDIVAFALRLVLIKATGSSPVLIADEPFKWLGKDRIPKAAALLKFLSHKLDIQIIVTSHHQALKDVADVSHELEIDENGIVKTVSEGV